MKKTTRIMAITLIAGVLVGGAALGTSALFTSTQKSENRLKITTGNLDIKLNEKEWVRNPEDVNKDGKFDARDRVYTNEKNTDKSEDGSFANVAPGDVFVRYIAVSNAKSTFDAKIEVSDAGLTGKNNMGNIVTVDSSNFVDGVNHGVDGNGILKKGTSIGGFIAIKIADGEEASKILNNSKTFDLNQMYDIKATQVK